MPPRRAGEPFLPVLWRVSERRTRWPRPLWQGLKERPNRSLIVLHLLLPAYRLQAQDRVDVGAVPAAPNLKRDRGVDLRPVSRCAAVGAYNAVQALAARIVAAGALHRVALLRVG